MKRWWLPIASFLVIGLAYLGQSLVAGDGALTPSLIADALTGGLIEVDIKGGTGLTGGCSGDIIEIGFKRMGPEDIEIAVPTGTVLVNTNSSEQNMVIRGLKGRDPSATTYSPCERIILDSGEWLYYLFEAYCLDMSKDNISSSSRFRLGEMASPEVVSMLKGADEVSAEIATVTSIQIALWVVYEGASAEQISQRITINDVDVNCACNLLNYVGLAAQSKALGGGTAGGTENGPTTGPTDSADGNGTLVDGNETQADGDETGVDGNESEADGNVTPPTIPPTSAQPPLTPPGVQPTLPDTGPTPPQGNSTP